MVNVKLENSNQYYKKNRSEMLKYIPDNINTVLEVGCGEGNFSELLINERNELEVWGCEYDEASGNKAKEKLFKVIVGDINKILRDLPDNYFDCIIFNDVIEHIENPWNLLESIKLKMANSGYIVSSIPNVRYYDNIKKLLINKDWEYCESGVLDKTHLRFFTEKSIKKLFVDAGFKIQYMSGLKGGVNTAFPFKFALLNLLLFNSLDDMRYLQFVTVCKKL